MEEVRDASLSEASKRDAAMTAAAFEAAQLEEKPVFDVNGVRLGRVTRCFAEAESVVRFDVTLSDNARGIFGVERHVASVPPDWIARVERDAVRLRMAGEQLLFPENPHSLRLEGGETNLTGARGRPRKNR